jgi:branched-subunit amino acid transport protein
MALWGTLFWVIAVVCALWVIYDVFMHQKKMKMEYKVLWTIAAIVFSIVTAIVYYFVQKKRG